MKKARSSTSPRHPNPQIVARPTASAAAAPRRVSHLTRRTTHAARVSSAPPARPGSCTARAGISGTTPRSRTARRTAGSPPNDPGSLAPARASARGPGTRTDVQRTRDNSCGTSFDVSHLDGVIVELALQQLARPEQPRLHRAHRDLENASDLLIRHPFHVAQHQRLTKRDRELIDGSQYLVIHDAVEERALWVLVLLLWEDGVRLDLVQVYRLGMPGAAAVFIDEGVPQNGKQPSLRVGSFLVLVPGAIGL